jgi:hypothetical protein
MKRLLTSVLVAAVSLSAAALVAQDAAKPSDKPSDSQSSSSAAAGTYQGTITQIDETGRSFVLRDQSGQNVTVYWDQSTRLMAPEASQGQTSAQPAASGIKVGDDVLVRTTAQGDKNVATTIQIRPKKSSS